MIVRKNENIQISLKSVGPNVLENIATGRYLNFYIAILEKKNRYKIFLIVIQLNYKAAIQTTGWCLRNLVFFMFTLLLFYTLENTTFIPFQNRFYGDYKTTILTIRKLSFTQQAVKEFEFVV